MKNNRKGLILGILLLAILATGVIVYTYSSYLSRASSTAETKIATWAVKVNNTDVVQNANFSLDENFITWSNSDYIAEGYFAPSRTGTMKIKIDTTGSKVAVKYTINIDTTAINNYSQINITKINGQPATGNTYTGIIQLANVNKPVEIPIEITWTNNAANNTSDTTIGSTVSELSVPITVTAEQYLGA